MQSRWRALLACRGLCGHLEASKPGFAESSFASEL